MQNTFSVEELIINDSFIHYCNGESAGDNFWEHYLEQYPNEKEKVEEARAFVLGLKKMLQATEKEKALERFRLALEKKKYEETRGVEESYKVIEMQAPHKRKNHWWYAAASIVLAAVSFVLLHNWKGKPETAFTRPAAAANPPALLAANGWVQTGAGEKKSLFLPDGTRVTLNAKTRLRLDSSFGKNSRVVSLEGEAFFDVVHNAASPFVVRLNDFNVKVLGTMFNVRSYAGDPSSETALVKGRVEITLKKDPARRLFLRPNEKAVLSNAGIEAIRKQGNGVEGEKNSRAAIVIKPLVISSDGSSVVETGWMQNRLEINDETFEELKNKLERWYDVDIGFANEDVKHYRFTATFEKENVEQALKALQLSYPFHYTQKNKEFMISK